MKIFAILTALVVLTACVDVNTPRNDCGEGFVNYVTPAGTEKCIKPGMAVQF